MEPIVLTNENFAEKITNSKGVSIVDFWAEWCGPCQQMLPILSDFAKEMGETVTVGKVNVDNETDLAKEFRVMSIPTLVVLKDGKAVNQLVGVHTVDQLKEEVAKFA